MNKFEHKAPFIIDYNLYSNEIINLEQYQIDTVLSIQLVFRNNTER